MKTSRNWPITPSTSVWLLILIAILHILEDLVKSTVRIIKVLAIAILILLRVKASRSGTTYLYKGLNLLFAASRPTTAAGAKTAPETSLELSLWLAMAKRARDTASYAFSRLLDSAKADFLGADGEAPSQEGSQDAATNGFQAAAEPEQ
ncbi:hypothetical protein VCV18_012233 [Metarhizium anisopliae]|uniref:Uncharacterized protein n=1 Tax=Metarhizium rileyi (strain RCEF 4871) TaxID=1649241 RepID=A0A5C6FY09_METRR|nr:hypothetical protein ED733_000113 [Metarhizium rileyi]